MSNFFNPLRLPPANLFLSETVAVSTTSAPSDRIPTYKDSKVHIYVENAGDSSNVTVTIYSSDSMTSTKKGVVKEFKLGAIGSGAEFGCIYLEPYNIPAYIYAVIKNDDSANTAVITTTVDRYR